jgi:hypothetical protein
MPRSPIAWQADPANTAPNPPIQSVSQPPEHAAGEGAAEQ